MNIEQTPESLKTREQPVISSESKLNNILQSLRTLEDITDKYSREPLNEYTATILAECNKARQIISPNISRSFEGPKRGDLLENTSTLGTDGDPKAIINLAKETIKLLSLAKKLEGEDLSRRFDIPETTTNKGWAFDNPLYRGGREGGEERRSEPRPTKTNLS